MLLEGLADRDHDVFKTGAGHRKCTQPSGPGARQEIANFAVHKQRIQSLHWNSKQFSIRLSEFFMLYRSRVQQQKSERTTALALPLKRGGELQVCYCAGIGQD